MLYNILCDSILTYKMMYTRLRYIMYDIILINEVLFFVDCECGPSSKGCSRVRVSIMYIRHVLSILH